MGLQHLTTSDFPSKHNLNAAIDPTSGDDTGDGYIVGSRWINTVNDTEFICLDNTLGAAVWKATTALTQDTVDSTGLLTGGVLSVGTGGPGVATTFSISDGSGQVVNNLGVKTDVSWSGLTDQALTYLATNLITFIAINSAGFIVQQTTPFTPTQARSNIVLGVIVHVNLTTVDTVNNEQHIAYNVMSSVYDAIEAIGFFNESGNIFSANGANLNINKSQGILFKMGSNYDTDINNPHERTLAAKIASQFQYRFSDGTSGILTETNIDPNNLDNGAGGLTAVGNNQWSIQRIYIFTSNNVKIQRGVADYPTLDAAIAGLSTESYVTEPSIKANGLLRGYLFVKKAATALNNSAEALFLEAGKFGESTGGTSSGTTTLQSAYLNSTANPEILTDTTGGSVTIRRGSAADTDKVLEVQNGAGTETFAVLGNGNITTSGTVDGRDIATDGAKLDGITGTNTGDQTITLTGDVTGSGTGSFAATIADNSVTLAKMQNAIANSKILGSGAAGAGTDYVEITLGSNLTMSGTTLNAAAGVGDVATDVIWDAAGDLVYGTGADTAVKLPIGTANQKLQVNSGATAPEWVTEQGAIVFFAPGNVVAGTGTVSVALVANDRITRELSGANANYNYYQEFFLPADFASFPTGAFKIETNRSDANNDVLITLGKGGVADSTINALSAGFDAALNTWSSRSLTPGSSYAAGDRIVMRINMTTSGNTLTRISNPILYYNKK